MRSMEPWVPLEAALGGGTADDVSRAAYEALGYGRGRCQSASPPPILSVARGPAQALSDGEDCSGRHGYARTQSRLIKARSISCLDNRLSIYRPAAAPSTAAASGASTRGPEQKENRQDAAPAGEGLSWSTLSLRTPPSSSIRRQISEWECRRVALPRMSLCLEKRGPPAEPPGSLLSSPCSDVPPSRRTSASFSDCSYPEPEGVQQDPPSRKEKCAAGRGEPAGLYARSLSSRKEGSASAVLSRIQKIEQALKDSPSPAAPQYPSSCYGPDRVTPRASATSSPCSSKRGSVSSAVTEPEGSPVLGSGLDALSRVRQRFSVISTRSVSPDLPPPSSSPSSPPTPVNPVPKPKRTFEDRDSCESEDTASLGSSHLSSPAENGLGPVESRSRPASKSTSEENAYEDILESMRENPYEDVDLRDRGAGRKAPRDSPNRMRTPQDRKFNSPPQLPSKPTSQSLRLPGVTDRKCRASRLTKRHSHDDMLLLPPPCSLLDERLSDGLPCQPRRVPKLVRRINSIYCAKRGKKRLKKLSLSSIDTASLRDDNSESESDSDDRFKAHTQRLQKLQSILRRAPSYRTLELQLLEWQERELFQYFVVISLKKKPTKSSYAPEVTYQFPKLERPTKEMREAEQRLKAIPQFCFPDAKDWSPVSEYSSETFSFMLTGEDGSRRFGYCRRLLPSGKGPRLPEVYCVISRLGCFDLFSKILDEVERRREISAALVYPFMRSLMESPFPAPGKTIRVKTFLPGAGNEVMELRRPADSRLEHVDLESLFRCLSVRQVVRVFASLLLERRVIFVADKLSTLSSCVHAVVALLYPFSWQHTFIPVLPASMVDIVCCPTPFLVGLLSSSLPKLRDLPVEEALMVDLGTDSFIKQMDDEASLLPRKLQAALEQALEQRNDIINQDSDSESDEECSSLNSLVSEAFIRFFLETIGHYSLFLTPSEQGGRVFQREAFRKCVASKSVRRFLGVFMESQMFAGFIQDRELRKCRAKGLFEQRVEQYLEELPDTEQGGVNKFLKGLGSKMKFLHKKN
ncbi:hypothetical protein AGOR_G00000230 [Albula goreensis]|uniref:UDENN domain-containing protein n=1 Tax=Albula goreensis TaxID=1534307 RepID=A0A8T3E6N9_9TELE|nr:hypothetical protein AGOR_G00000230 [Albula goreensis]